MRVSHGPRSPSIPFQFRSQTKQIEIKRKIDSVKDSVEIIFYSSVVINESFFLVGGLYDNYYLNRPDKFQRTIARLDAATWTWSNAGQLNTARSHHGAIWSMSKLIVVGGTGDEKPAEFCQLTDNRFNCVEQKSRLQGYLNPLLFVVSDEYKNC